MSTGMVILPEDLIEHVLEVYGKGKVKEILSVYIEESEKLLSRDSDNKVILGAKRILKRNNLTDNARLLVSQLSGPEKEELK
jgi:hypothetical protein